MSRAELTYDRWVLETYLSGLRLPDLEGGVLYAELLKSLKTPEACAWKQVPKRFNLLKGRTLLSPSGYACLTMSTTLEGVTVQYARAYWRLWGESPTPDYICVSYTYSSRDGEYRKHLLLWSDFVSLLGRADSDKHEEAAVALIAENSGLAAYPEGEAERLEAAAGEKRLPVMALTLTLMAASNAREWGFRERHAQPEMEAFLGKLDERFPGLLGGAREGQQQELTSHVGYCGMKLVPMSVREVMQPRDSNLAVWRELAAMRRASDLVINYVCPNLAIYNGWTYLEGADATLFETEGMRGRYARGVAAESAATDLRRARRRLAEASRALVDYHTGGLDVRIYEGLEYAQSFLLLSSVAILHTVEHVGPTLSTELKGQPWALEHLASPDEVAHLIFELAYTARCLHSKAGFAHTDIHVNNITWRLLRPEPSGASIAYVLGSRGEADTFVFPELRGEAYLIDFSRCILGPSFRAELEAGRSPRYATDFYRNQDSRVLRALHRYAPEYVGTNQAAIKAAILTNFEAVYATLCAVDFIAIGVCFKALLGGTSPEGARLARRLEDGGRSVLLSGLAELVRGRTPDPGACASMLARTFSRWSFGNWEGRGPGRSRPTQLGALYSAVGELRYGSGSYERFPPWARLDETQRCLGKEKITDFFYPAPEAALEGTLQPGVRVEVAASEAHADQARLDGQPPSVGTSSWLDE